MAFFFCLNKLTTRQTGNTIPKAGGYCVRGNYIMDMFIGGSCRYGSLWCVAVDLCVG